MHVAEEAAALADEHQQAAARVVVLLVVAQVLGQLVDALGEQGDLDAGVPRVLGVLAELRDDLLLALLGKAHATGQTSSGRRGFPASARRPRPSARPAPRRSGSAARRAGARGTRPAAAGRR